jgi:hypothetical protein
MFAVNQDRAQRSAGALKDLWVALLEQLVAISDRLGVCEIFRRFLDEARRNELNGLTDYCLEDIGVRRRLDPKIDDLVKRLRTGDWHYMAGVTVTLGWVILLPPLTLRWVRGAWLRVGGRIFASWLLAIGVLLGASKVAGTPGRRARACRPAGIGSFARLRPRSRWPRKRAEKSFLDRPQSATLNIEHRGFRA